MGGHQPRALIEPAAAQVGPAALSEPTALIGLAALTGTFSRSVNGEEAGAVFQSPTEAVGAHQVVDIVKQPSPKWLNRGSNAPARAEERHFCSVNVESAASR